MLALLMPDLYIKSLLDIPMEMLVEKGIRGLIIDLDNTITEWNGDHLRQEVVNWFNSLADYRITSCVVSNNGRDRVARIADTLGIPSVPKAGKPRRRAFYQAMKVLGTQAHETAVIGDQVFTDVLGGNRLGLLTVLVVPVSRREFIGTRLVRQVERLVLRSLNKNLGGRFNER
ncbi:MAG: YqeG family HAD IIIA-type phosphatase [Bacillota bacterium]